MGYIEVLCEPMCTYTRHIAADHIIRLFRIVRRVHFRIMGQYRYSVINWLLFGTSWIPRYVDIVQTFCHQCMRCGQILEWLRCWKEIALWHRRSWRGCKSQQNYVCSRHKDALKSCMSQHDGVANVIALAGPSIVSSLLLIPLIAKW